MADERALPEAPTPRLADAIRHLWEQRESDSWAWAEVERAYNLLGLPSGHPALLPEGSDSATDADEWIAQLRDKSGYVYFPQAGGDVRLVNAETAEALAATLESLTTALRTAEQAPAALEREVRSWRWLHWDQPDAMWACPCGAAIGHALDECCECGALRPSKDRPIYPAAANAARDVEAELEEAERIINNAAHLMATRLEGKSITESYVAAYGVLFAYLYPDAKPLALEAVAPASSDQMGCLVGSAGIVYDGD